MVMAVCLCSLQKAWKKDEDKALIKLAKEHHFTDWEAIARELGVRTHTYS